MLPLSRILAGCLVATSLATAAGAAGLRLTGKFAFRTDADPGRTSCAAITAKTASQLASTAYTCESAPLSSGKRALLCSPKAGHGGYLVFDTKAACDSERKDESVAE